MKDVAPYSRRALDVLTRLASPSAYLAVPVFVLAFVTIALFFRAGEPFGTINDFFDAIALLLLVPPVLALQGRAGEDAGGWLGPLTALTALGLVVAAVGQFLLIARIIDLNGSYITGGIGILPFLVWVMAIVWLSFGRQLLPAPLGWSAAALIGCIVLLSIFASLKLDIAVWAGAALLMAALLAWLIALAAAVSVQRAAGLPA